MTSCMRGAGVQQLSTLQQLTQLNLAYTKTGSEGLTALASLSTLCSLNLDSCDITDE